MSEFKLQMIKESMKSTNVRMILNIQTHDSFLMLQIQEDIAEELREHCADYLLQIGFDSDYNPNEKENALESLIDKLFTE